MRTILATIPILVVALVFQAHATHYSTELTEFGQTAAPAEVLEFMRNQPRDEGGARRPYDAAARKHSVVLYALQGLYKNPKTTENHLREGFLIFRTKAASYRVFVMELQILLAHANKNKFLNFATNLALYEIRTHLKSDPDFKNEDTLELLFEIPIAFRALDNPEMLRFLELAAQKVPQTIASRPSDSQEYNYRTESIKAWEERFFNTFDPIWIDNSPRRNMEAFVQSLGDRYPTLSHFLGREIRLNALRRASGRIHRGWGGERENFVLAAVEILKNGTTAEIVETVDSLTNFSGMIPSSWAEVREIPQILVDLRIQHALNKALTNATEEKTQTLITDLIKICAGLVQHRTELKDEVKAQEQEQCKKLLAILLGDEKP